MNVDKEIVLKILQSIIDKYDLEDHEIIAISIAIDCIDRNEDE